MLVGVSSMVGKDHSGADKQKDCCACMHNGKKRILVKCCRYPVLRMYSSVQAGCLAKIAIRPHVTNQLQSCLMD